MKPSGIGSFNIGDMQPHKEGGNRAVQLTTYLGTPGSPRWRKDWIGNRQLIWFTDSCQSLFPFAWDWHLFGRFPIWSLCILKNLPRSRWWSQERRSWTSIGLALGSVLKKTAEGISTGLHSKKILTDVQSVHFLSSGF